MTVIVQTATTFLLLLIIIIQSVRFHILNKEVDELKDDMQEVKYKRNHFKRVEQGVIESSIRENKKLIEKLATSLDKKVEPEEQITYYSYGFGEEEQEHTRVVGYKIVDLTDKEKTINELRKQADELEANQ